MPRKEWGEANTVDAESTIDTAKRMKLCMMVLYAVYGVRSSMRIIMRKVMRIIDGDSVMSMEVKGGTTTSNSEWWVAFNKPRDLVSHFGFSVKTAAGVSNFV